VNGNHFAEEFIRRKKLADRGVVEKQPSVATPPEGKAGASGWNEVAKKGGHNAKETDSGIQGVGFKVVSGKKKGGKK
jgi:PERQ amino acid-rich with GYF domain-containing protein